MQQADPAHLSIELELKNDRSGAYKGELVALFLDEIAKTKREMNRGVVPEEFQRLGLVVKALESAVKVTDEMWHRFQQNN